MTGTRIRTKVEDCNEVERGEVTIPIGHTGVIGAQLLDSDEYVMDWDDMEGLEMGWTIWTSEQILRDAVTLEGYLK